MLLHLLYVFSVVSISTALVCDEGFVLFDNYCYNFKFISIRATYKQAVNLCKTLNANITSIRSEAENDFINIGNDTVWKWTDGSPFIYENWQLFQPNDCCGEDITCARMNWLLLTGAWFDTSCLEKNGVVCKYDPAARIVPTTTLPPPPPPPPSGSALDVIGAIGSFVKMLSSNTKA